MRLARKPFIALLLIAAFLASCGGTDSDSPTPDINAMLTAGVETVVASFFQTQTALVTPATQTSTSTPIPTNTPFGLSSLTVGPTSTAIFFNTSAVLFTASPTGTQYTPTANPSTLAYGCNNLLLIDDVTIPAGTVFQPKQTFTKTWKVANTGTCDWVYLYRLVFFGGEAMGGEPAKLNKVIEPGKWTQLSVGLTAPKNPGTYTGYWRFGDQSGNMFGSTLTVSIVVASPTKTPAPATATSVPPTATPTETPTDTVP